MNVHANETLANPRPSFKKAAVKQGSGGTQQFFKVLYLQKSPGSAVAVCRYVGCAEQAPRPVCRAAPAAKGGPISHATNFHLALHAVYKNPPDAKVEQLQLLEELTLQRLDELNGDALITVMSAFARSGYLPHLHIPHRMAAASEAGMAALTPHQLEAAVASLAAVGYRPSEGWLNEFGRALQVQWDSFRAAQLASTLLQAAECGLTRLPSATLRTQMPALLSRLADPPHTPACAPLAPPETGTLAKLVWSAGHFGTGGTNGEAADTAGAAGAGAAGSPAAALPLLPERELLDWWAAEGVVETADPGDLVLLLHGLARLGVRPGPALTRRLLAAVMGCPRQLARLPLRRLALLAWSALKLAPEEPPRREWLEGLVAALRVHLGSGLGLGTGPGLAGRRSAERPEARTPTAAPELTLGGSGSGRGGGDDGSGDGPRHGMPPAVGEGGAAGASCQSRHPISSTPSSAVAAQGCAHGDDAEDAPAEAGPAAEITRPADVALALSSLAGLGWRPGSAGAAGDFAAYWRRAGHWAALSGEDRLVMSLLGYGPGQVGQRTGLEPGTDQ